MHVHCVCQEGEQAPQAPRLSSSSAFWDPLAFSGTPGALGSTSSAGPESAEPPPLPAPPPPPPPDPTPPPDRPPPDRSKISLFFPLSSRKFHCVLLSLGVFSWNGDRDFYKAVDHLKCAFGVIL